MPPAPSMQILLPLMPHSFELYLRCEFRVGPGSGPNSSLISSQYFCASLTSRLSLSCAKYSELIDLLFMCIRPTLTGCVGCGGAGQALIISESKLLLFFVFPLFSRNGLLLSIGESLQSSTALCAVNAAVVMSAEILGASFDRGLWWIEAFCGRGDACHPVCTTGVLNAVMTRTFALSVESIEHVGEPKSFSGTGGGLRPRWRMTGRRRRFRSHKHMNMLAVIRMKAMGIIASPAIDFDERPWFSCAGAAGFEIVAGVVEMLPVDMVFVGIVNRWDVDIVACCMRGAGEEGEGCMSDASWTCATTSCVVVCDAARPSKCTTLSIEFIVAARHLSMRHQ